jgi:hypothetical protein
VTKIRPSICSLILLSDCYKGADPGFDVNQIGEFSVELDVLSSTAHQVPLSVLLGYVAGRYKGVLYNLIFM